MDYVNEHLKNLYGMNPSIPHMAFQFPRLPPGITHPGFRIPDNLSMKRLSKDTMNKNLYGFQRAYQMYASGLLAANQRIVPPGHPLYTNQDSLKSENEKLLKENMELKKKIMQNDGKNPYNA